VKNRFHFLSLSQKVNYRSFYSRFESKNQICLSYSGSIARLTLQTNYYFIFLSVILYYIFSLFDSLYRVSKYVKLFRHINWYVKCYSTRLSHFELILSVSKISLNLLTTGNLIIRYKRRIRISCAKKIFDCNYNIRKRVKLKVRKLCYRVNEIFCDSNNLMNWILTIYKLSAKNDWSLSWFVFFAVHNTLFLSISEWKRFEYILKILLSIDWNRLNLSLNFCIWKKIFGIFFTNI
jgi:hypothetical protein